VNLAKYLILNNKRLRLSDSVVLIRPTRFGGAKARVLMLTFGTSEFCGKIRLGGASVQSFSHIWFGLSGTNSDPGFRCRSIRATLAQSGPRSLPFAKAHRGCSHLARRPRVGYRGHSTEWVNHVESTSSAQKRSGYCRY